MPPYSPKPSSSKSGSQDSKSPKSRSPESGFRKSRFPKSKIVVFAREPKLGEVKTRLRPALGDEDVLVLYRKLLRRILGTVSSSNLAAGELWVTANPQHQDFLASMEAQDIHLQGEGDLGVRMGQCIDMVLARADAESVLLVGTDCPAMDAGYLSSALQALERSPERGSGNSSANNNSSSNSSNNEANDVVIGPAEDGGYVLIGMSRAWPQIFTGIDWGSDRVLAQTLAKLDAAGAKTCVLEPLWDIDRPEDLARLESLDPPL